VDSTRCSALRVGDTQIATVEHLLAALAGLRIDNARIEVEGPEIPALDGSALPFAEGIMAAGIHEQSAPARVIRLPRAEWISDGDRHVVAVPAEGLTVATAVDYGRPLAGPQIFAFSFDATPQPAAAVLALAGATMGPQWDFVMPEPVHGTATGCDWRSPLPFLQELAPARTFCFDDWIAPIRAAGLGRGGSIENTVLIDDHGTSTPLRFMDELARHKALDLLGDLALIGARLYAIVVAVKAGHALHLSAAGRIRRAADGY
jgi:UDP-3-O-[3-hydroxymyristoyl] N-acetylglucosamine deacetylase